MNQYLERSIFKKPLQIGSNITKEIVVWWRQFASNPRPLPDFIIIGAQKGGTTSLFSYLSQHSQIRPSIKKEINFFSQNFHRGLPWYRAHFPLVTSSEEMTRSLATIYF
jgi:hypothetical protein